MSYCYVDLPEHERVQCDDYPVGGMDAIAILETDANIADYSSASDWTTAANAGKTRIVKGIKGEFPDASPIEGDNPVGCGAETILDGFNFTLVIEDYNSMAENDDFWATANGRTVNIAWRECEQGQIRVVEEPVTVVAIPANNPKSNTEKQRYMVTLKWRGKRDSYPVRYDEPTGIFD